MKKLTNHHDGPRGINLTNGGTRWIEPGETIEIDAKDIAGDVPDLGKAPEAADSDDAELIAAVEQANADLTKQVADLTKERDELKKAADEAGKSNEALTKQVADLTAALEKAKKPAA